MHVTLHVPKIYDLRLDSASWTGHYSSVQHVLDLQVTAS